MKIYRLYVKSREVTLNIEAVNKPTAIDQLVILYRTNKNDVVCIEINPQEGV